MGVVLGYGVSPTVRAAADAAIEAAPVAIMQFARGSSRAAANHFDVDGSAGWSRGTKRSRDGDEAADE